MSALIFGISGTLISVCLRIELYSSGYKIISSESQNFYSISVTLHGFRMIFFLIMPGLFGGFGNYFVPIFQGSPEAVYPTVNMCFILVLSLSSIFVILHSISEFGGGAPEAVYPTVNMCPILVLSLSSIFVVLHSISEFGGGAPEAVYPT